MHGKVHNMCTCIHTHTQTKPNMPWHIICIQALSPQNTHTYTLSDTDICLHTHTHTLSDTDICLHTHTHTHTHFPILTYVYTHTHFLILTYVYTHTHTF